MKFMLGVILTILAIMSITSTCLDIIEIENTGGTRQMLIKVNEDVDKMIGMLFGDCDTNDTVIKK